MPTYDYQCEACGEAWEEFQGIREEPLRKCPHCGKLKAVRLFGTGAAVVFKGSGFYQTDYRSESYRKGEQAEQKKTEKGGEPAKTGQTGESSKADSSSQQVAGSGSAASGSGSTGTSGSPNSGSSAASPAE